MTDITELTSVQKNANIHRLSRLIAYASNDELRQTAVEVEHYTDQLIEALEKAQQRIEELEYDLSEWTDCKHDGATYYDMSGQERCGRCGADL
ncbi:MULTISPECIES: hypothetical protein [Klebsiella]|uniref:hypothetical protein n=1 Tax=Klebsiella pneumoniae complex TaxID=3390273 RepID=UPI0002C406BD|nr:MULTISPECIES: hypothetical protein [Klebsiella]HDU5425789.1 hypothetical protein [Klebsiella pneumoniae subsp. pneumoniae]AVF88906.1 hypothetical protein AL473_14840 [Klebsiella quasipneumoniae]AWO59569.1 hypothetical protein DLJ73_00135 [Klebsiella quasipneumoniae subsp. similipneumoniae]EMR16129.1 hypothetical protein KP700603_23418 [Klebsiella quasipneumoniae]MBK5762852.1 hypothetical protein [Klebsiella quasipneumoniae]